MTIEWLEEDWLAGPIVQVNDDSTIYSAFLGEALTLQQIAADYGAQSANQTTRQVTVRQVDATNGFGAWQEFTVPYVPPPPLETLAWNQGWPPATEIPYADVLDDNTHYNAPNPEGWTLDEIAEDYANGFVEGTNVHICENRTSHEVQVREVSAAAGNGPWEYKTVNPT